MTTDKPFFRFNPNAFEKGRAFEQSSDQCDVCKKPAVWRHTLGVYAVLEPEICARCIFDGTVAAFLENDSFAFHDIEVDEIDPELYTELLQRTPGIATFNPFTWPVLDGMPLAFIGYGDDLDVMSDLRAQKEIAKVFGELGDKVLLGAPCPYALVFREIDGERYIVEVNYD
jgi:uncharacterized protein